MDKCHFDWCHHLNDHHGWNLSLFQPQKHWHCFPWYPRQEYWDSCQTFSMFSRLHCLRNHGLQPLSNSQPKHHVRIFVDNWSNMVQTVPSPFHMGILSTILKTSFLLSLHCNHASPNGSLNLRKAIKSTVYHEGIIQLLVKIGDILVGTWPGVVKNSTVDIVLDATLIACCIEAQSQVS